ncbi:MAG TPA: hypothetical protein VK858_02665 [Longimicrobiales bacterium]|nr:hypothetical protein [Longimicrobiales bacterium]
MRWVEFLAGAAVGAVLVLAWVRRRRVLRERIQQASASLDDRAVEEIIHRGVLEVEGDEPLDLDEIAEAERAFWETEEWDPAEEDRA